MCIRDSLYTEETGKSAELRVNKALNSALCNIGKFRHGDSQSVHCDGNRLAVEVTAGEDVSVIREDQWVIGYGVDFCLNYACLLYTSYSKS